MSKLNECQIVRLMRRNTVNITRDALAPDNAGGHYTGDVIIKDAAAAVMETSLFKRNLLQREVNSDTFEFWVFFDERILDNKGLNVEWNGNQYEVVDGPSYDRNKTPELISMIAQRVVK